MAQYGYMFKSASSYNTIREESRGPAIKPFVPFVPNSNYNPSTNSDGYATKKKIVPVASRPYDDYDDNYKKRSSPTSGEFNHRQRSPDHVAQQKFDDFLTKVQNEASRPQWNSLPTNDWRYSPQATSYNGPAFSFSYAKANGDDYVGNKDARKPIASTIRDHDYAGPNGYGGYGNYNNKEGHRPSSSPNRNDKYACYDDYDNYEGHRSIKSPKYGSYNGGNDFGDYGNRNKEELKPIRGNEGYAANNGYGNYNNGEEQMPFGSSPKSVNYGGNGFGDYGGDYTNKDRHKPISVSWTPPPRKGIQLSEPTNNMDKALELLKEAARVSSNDLSNKGGHRAASPTALPYENRDDYQLRHGGADKSAPSNSWAAALGKEPKSKFDKSMELVKEAEKLKSIVTAPSIDRRDATNQFANLKISSMPKAPPKHSTFIGKEVDYNRRGYGNAPIINSKTAEEIYGGRRI